MAINKNFVIKNGVQVATDLIVGDSDTKKVGIGTTVAGYTLHVGATNAGGRGGIGATDAVVTGVGTIKDLIVTGFSGFSSDVRVTGIVSAQSFGIGTTEVIDRGLRLSGIASLDAITINTIEQAIRVGPNSFTDLKVTGLSTFVGVATFLGGIDVDNQSGVSTFSAPVQFGLGPSAASANVKNFVATAATVGFGTSVFFRDNASIFMGDSSDFRLYHDNTNSFIDNMTGALFVRNSVDNDDNSSITFQAKSGENSIVMTNSADESNEVELYYDGAKKLQTTSGGVQITGIATLTNRLHVQAGVSTFDADVRFGIGATVGFGTSAFFKDDAAIFLGDDSDLKIHHDGSNSRIQDVGTGDLILQGSADIKLQSASAENYIVANDTGSVDIFFDNSKKVETTSGGLKVTGITTLTDRLHVEAGISTFDADVRFGIGATVGFGTSAFFKDDAAIFLGDDSDLKIHHDGSNSRIQDVGTGDLILQGSADIKLQSASAENYIVANDTGSVEIYFDNSKKVETTSGGLNVTGITTFSDRINVVSGVSTFQDNAKLTFGAQSDLSIIHDGTNSSISNSTGQLEIISDDLDIRSATGDEHYFSAQVGGAASIFYDNINVVQTTPQGINVSGVTTSNRLNISGVSTFTSIGSNLIPDTDGSRNIGAATSEWGNLFIDGTAKIDTLTVDENAGVTGDLTVTGGTILNGNVDLGDATSDTITATGRFDSDLVPSTDGARDLGSSSLEWEDLHIDGTAHIDTLDVDETAFITTKLSVGTGVTAFANGNLAVAGIATITDRLHVQSGISTFDDTTQSTSATTGAVVIDGGLGVAKNVNIGGNLTVTGTSTFNGGTITLGDADTDNVVFSADVDSNIIPDDDDSFDLGSSTKEWQDLFIDGTAHIDTLDVDESAFVTTTLTVGTGLTVHPHGNLAVAGITTIGGNLLAGGDILPDDDGARDLGSSSKEFQDLFIDGTANIDSLAADTAAIGDLTSGRVVLAGTSGELEDSSNLRFDGGNLVVTGDMSASSKIHAGTGVTIFATTGNAAFAGIVTANGGLLVGAGATINGDLSIPDKIVHTGHTDTAIRFAGDDIVTMELAGTEHFRVDTTATRITDKLAHFGDPDTQIRFPAANTFTVETAGSEVVRVTSDGKIGIGDVSSPDANVEIRTDSNGEGVLIKSTGNTSNALTFDANRGTEEIIGVVYGRWNGTTVAQMNFISGLDGTDKNDGDITFGTESAASNGNVNATERLRITSTGRVNAVGVVSATGGVQVGAAITLATNGNAGFTGIVTAGGGFNIGIQSAGTVQASGPIKTLNFVGTGNTFLYNAGTDTIDISIAGGGGSGGVSETETSVSTTSATSCGSFVKTAKRSAAILAQITQGSAYQIGRYLLIHDGTTVTTIEEAAVATGDMLGTFEGVINGSNVEFRVTMNSSSSATVTTKIDSISIP